MRFEAMAADGNAIDKWYVYSIGGGNLRDEYGVLNAEKIYSHNKMSDILRWCKQEGKSLWEYVEDNEGPEIWQFLHDVWLTMKEQYSVVLIMRAFCLAQLSLPEGHRRIIQKP